MPQAPSLTQDHLNALAQEHGWTTAWHDEADPLVRHSWLSPDRGRIVAVTYMRDGSISAVTSIADASGYATELISGPTSYRDDAVREIFA